jgi:hypothetical protein
MRHGVQKWICAECRNASQRAKMRCYLEARQLAAQGATLDRALLGTAERVLAINNAASTAYRRRHPERHTRAVLAVRTKRKRRTA